MRNVYQTSVLNTRHGLPYAFIGDLYQGNMVANQGFVANDNNCVLGNFGFTDGQAYTVYGVNAPGRRVAGLLILDNTVSFNNFADAVNDVLPLGQNGNFMTRGSAWVEITTVLGTGGIQVGQKVYAKDADGSLAVGVTTESGYTPTNFVVYVADRDGLSVITTELTVQSN